MSKFWVAMASRYGHRWVSQYGERDDGTWLRALGDLSAEQVRIGVQLMGERHPAWPPTLYEFRALCLYVPDRSDGAAVAARMPAARGLPEPESVKQARRERAASGLEACWRVLGIDRAARRADGAA